VGGREASLEAAIGEAAAILGAARFPLVHGLGVTTVEAQREAVALAEAIGGVLDPSGPALDGAAGRAFQEMGWSTATLGEVRARAGLVVCWRADPLSTHPRLLSRYASRPGRRPELVVVDDRPTATAGAADLVLPLAPERDFEVLWGLRAAVREARVDPALESGAGLPPNALADLLDRLRQVEFATFVFGPEIAGAGHRHARALLALVTDLNRVTHAVAVPLRREANAAGAEDVSAWQTGYPFAVDFARGHPRSNPDEFGAVAILGRGEADAALAVAADPLEYLPEVAARRLRAIPSVYVGSRENATAAAARVAILTAVPGLEVGGTVHRMDGVPLALRVPRAPRPGDAAVLRRLREAVPAR
jgi:formylmethanofuran dehydrogenase subunit B